MDPKLAVAQNLRTLVWHLRTSNPIFDQAIKQNSFNNSPLRTYQELVLEMAPMLEKYVLRQGSLKGEDFRNLIKEFSNSKDNYYERLSEAIDKSDLSLLKPQEAQVLKESKAVEVVAPKPPESPVTQTNQASTLAQPKSAETIQPKQPAVIKPPQLQTQEMLQQLEKKPPATEEPKVEPIQKAETPQSVPPEQIQPETAPQTPPAQPAIASSRPISRPPRLTRTSRIPTSLGRTGRIVASGARGVGNRMGAAVGPAIQRGTKVLLPRAAGSFLGGLRNGIGGLLGASGGRGNGGGGFSIPGFGRGGRFSGGGFGRSGLGRAAQAGGKKWLLLLLLLLIGGMIFFNLFGAPAEKGKGDVDIQKVGPCGQQTCEVANGTNITYTLTVTFKGTGSADIIVTDPIPANTDYVSSGASTTLERGNDFVSGNFKGVREGNNVVWRLKDIPANLPQTLTLTLKPKEKDIWVVNEASWNLNKASPGGAGGTTLSPAEAEQQDRELQGVIGGQGRNVNILGDEETFTQTVIKNGSKLGVTPDKEQFVRVIYRAAVKNRVNPLIVLGTWGTEVGFSTASLATAFSCPVGVVSSFERQANCAAETYSNWMKAFEDKNQGGTLGIDEVRKDGSKKGKVCTYNDPIIYAFDWYGPICHYYHQNENYRPNMIKFYKTFLGQYDQLRT